MTSFVTRAAAKLGFFAILSGLLLGNQSAHAQAPASTLARIAETGKIRIGYGDTPPFSYKDEQGQVIGYSIDLCRKMSEELRQQLKLPTLEIEFIHRTPSNRVQMLNDGGMDIECNASTNSEERRRSAAFSYSHYFVATRFVALAKNNLKTIDDLKGRSVSVTFGTVNVAQINRINREHKLNLSVIPAETLQAAFDMVGSGKVAAYAMDDVLLKSMIARSGKPEDYSISEDLVSDPLPYGFMMRLNDVEFQTAVNAALRKIYASPEMTATYDRWFRQPLPRDNINLNMPMSDMLRDALKQPELKNPA